MKQWIKEQLAEGKIRKIYDITLKNLDDRLTEDGFLPESFTGKYEGAFTRSIGAQALFLLEQGKTEEARALLVSLFEIVKEFHLPRFPHWYNIKQPRIDMKNQVDGDSHALLAYATYCLETGDPEMIGKYYHFACKSIVSIFSAPYFDDGSQPACFGGDWDRYPEQLQKVADENYTVDPAALNLVHNFFFEHSREYKMWDCYDFLTQCFAGKAAEQMYLLMQKQGDRKLANWLGKKIEAHRLGVTKNMTFAQNGKVMYYEMLTGDPLAPFPALGWPLFGYIASGWSGIDWDIYCNTIDYLLERTTIVDPVSGANVNMKEYLPDGRIFPCTMGKDVGWSLEYCLATKKWSQIADWIRFFNENYPEDLLTEYIMPADKDGKPLIHKADILFEGDLPSDARWIVEDGGNGEQCIWFCRAIYRLIKAFEQI
jgi:hypothetical protein